MAEGALDLAVAPALVMLMATNSDEFGTGSGFKISVLITVKTVVFAPMPNPSVRTTNNTNSGPLRMVRRA